MKKYEFSMSSGNSTTYAILTSPEFDNGIVRATQVAVLDGFTEDGKLAYRKCEEKEFIAGGGPYTLVEYTGAIEEEE